MRLANRLPFTLTVLMLAVVTVLPVEAQDLARTRPEYVGVSSERLGRLSAVMQGSANSEVLPIGRLRHVSPLAPSRKQGACQGRRAFRWQLGGNSFQIETWGVSD